MIRYPTLVIILFLTVAKIDFAQHETPNIINPDTLQWFSPLSDSQFSATWVIGNEKEAEPYILQVKIKANGIIPPHSHPDVRYTTVLFGTLYIGFDKSIDDSNMVAVSRGEVYCVPSNVTHYLKARNNDVTYQEFGFGPTATTATAVFK